jgi:two-component system chemotaxis response regulator CheB
MIRVLIAEGSPFQANFLARALKGSGVAESVGVARNGEEAVVLAHRLKPDVIMMDVGIPVLQAPLATRQIMDHAPSPILIPAEPSSLDAAMAFVALDEGAIDLVSRARTPMEEEPPRVGRLLAKRVALVARSHLDTRSRKNRAPRGAPLPPVTAPSLVLMGGAVGGIQATTEILRSLSACGGSGFSGTICLVQHLEPGFLDGYARWLAAETGFRVEICRQEQELAPRTVYLAPGDAHLVLTSPETVGPQRGRAIGGHQPSITALYRSAATHRPTGFCAVVLSGEGRDGVEGIKLLAEKDGLVVVQKPESCLVKEMPRHALRAQIPHLELTPGEIAGVLSEGADRPRAGAQKS